MAIVKKYQSTITRIENPIDNIFIVHFKSDKQFKYKPGQFLHLAIDNYDPAHPWPESRCFSMQSSPSSEEIIITFAVKGSFTKRMANELSEGKSVWLKLPYGNLFDNVLEKENCVFIAGGTGVTPFLSLFNDPVFQEYKNSTLYLGVRTPSHHIYQQAIDLAFKINPFFFCNLVNQQTEGMLNIEKIHSFHGNNTSYFISGPPEMIRNFKNFLIKKNLPENMIITDDWE